MMKLLNPTHKAHYPRKMSLNLKSNYLNKMKTNRLRSDTNRRQSPSVIRFRCHSPIWWPPQTSWPITPPWWPRPPKCLMRMSNESVIIRRSLFRTRNQSTWQIGSFGDFLLVMFCVTWSPEPFFSTHYIFTWWCSKWTVVSRGTFNLNSIFLPISSFIIFIGLCVDAINTPLVRALQSNSKPKGVKCWYVVGTVLMITGVLGIFQKSLFEEWDGIDSISIYHLYYLLAICLVNFGWCTVSISYQNMLTSLKLSKK